MLTVCEDVYQLASNQCAHIEAFWPKREKQTIIAHGKRSDGQVGDILAAKASSNESPRNGVVPSSKTQWILSRLIAGQPVLPLPAKYRVRWSGLAKDRDAYASPKWEYDTDAATYDEGVEPIGWVLSISKRTKWHSREELVCD